MSYQDSVVSGATLVDGTQLAPQQLGLMGMEALETVIRYRILTSYWSLELQSSALIGS